MEKEIKEVVNSIGSGILSSDDTSELTKHAIRMAEIALTSFSGELLDKALNISKAIVEYENELTTLNKL